jgi:hypothetical protein
MARKVRARILGLDVRKRIDEARRLWSATGGKPIVDVPGEMIDLRRLCRQLADDAERLLDAIGAERGCDDGR